MRGFVAAPHALLALCLTVAISSAAPAQRRDTYAVKESHPVPRKWKNAGRAPGSHVINLSIALKQSQFAELERHLDESMFALS